MTFDPGTWWLVVGLLGLGGTALAFLLKRNMTESDRTKDRVTELEARSAQKSDVDKVLEKVNKTVAEQGKAISHIEKTYVEKDELQAVRKELREETRKLQADIEDIKENCLRKEDFSDRKQVSSTLAKWQQDLELLEHEEDVSITTDGTVWHTVGGKRRVHPENIQLQQGVSLQGSYSYHNHPPKETYYSFSADDVDFFFRFGVQYQQASDDVYEYSIERTPDTTIPENAAAEFKRVYNSEARARAFEDESWDIDENGYDLVLRRLAELYNFKYERRRKG